eukprot:maker-scaffold1830_size26949-snap-gene-0.7 protein:Tk12641 transcript:maker-scaffold1830_size26949-snap-gene-0.7-mRNA-1 annotation:"hypothetical protein TcasGA2_TC001292"
MDNSWYGMEAAVPVGVPGVASTVASSTQREFECLTPFKLCLALLLRNYCVHVRGGFDIEQELETVNLMSSRQRKRFLVLALRLNQGPDLPLSQLIEELLRSEYDIPPTFLNFWKINIHSLVEKDVSGLMDVFTQLGGLVPDDVQYATMSRPAIFPLFFRRLVLYGERLGFSEAAALTAIFVDYVRAGEVAFNQITGGPSGDGVCLLEDLEMSLSSSEVAKINHGEISIQEAHATPTGFDGCVHHLDAKVVHTRRQAELYIAQQVELIQYSEVNADSIGEIQRKVGLILQSNLDLAEAHFLLYLNALRSNDYCEARSNLNRAFEIGFNSQKNGGGLLTHDDLIKGPRYAALNLAALHAHFGHTQPALTALNECITLAQEANDLVCLQHALSWLIKLDGTLLGSHRQRLIQTFVKKATDLQLPYLRGFGFQNLAKVILEGEGDAVDPGQILLELSRCEQVGAQSETTELLSASLVERSSFWSRLGQGYLSVHTSLLLLNLDTSSAKRGGHYMVCDSLAISLASLAGHLFDTGHSELADLVIGLCKTLFPNHSSPNGTRWRRCQIEMEFRKSLYETDFVTAKKWILALEPLDAIETRFLETELMVWRGNASGLGSKLDEVQALWDESKLDVIQEVRYHIYRSEWFCLMSSYSYALDPLLKAINVCYKRKLEYWEKIAKLHLAHVQLQIGLPLDALESLDEILPVLLRHNIMFETSRAYLLLGKSLVASAPKGQSEESRVVQDKAMKALHQALSGFKQVGAYHRAKDVLYTIARLYHAQDMIRGRNQTSAEFRRIDEQHPTYISSKIALML